MTGEQADNLRKIYVKQEEMKSARTPFPPVLGRCLRKPFHRSKP